MESNPQLELAYDFLEYTGVNVFLTGKAGTGKTTFLRELKRRSPKRMIVVAPTGVAAINAGGVTIHSFFQLPFGPYVPGVTEVVGQGDKLHYTHKFNREKINIIKTIDLLVIDEISMVRADLLDAVDDMLRRYRSKNEPFGGVQLLLIGDLQQLAPVVKEDEWALLKQHYASAFFFHSKALAATRYVMIELKHVYRQQDREFVDLLNRVRENRVDTAVLGMLNRRYIPDFKPSDEEGYITLTTHNHQAQRINDVKMAELSTRAYSFKAEVKDNFPTYSYPTEETLVLKQGAQVMFVKNDSSPEKRYYNGKIGKITAINDRSIEVVGKEDGLKIQVTPEEWTNTRYTLDEETREITETVEGTFKQYPLKTAWAITIHKSQGLTFERAIVDANAAFAHGQVYVALSRCTSLEGLVLKSKISSRDIFIRKEIVEFSQIFNNQALIEKSIKESEAELQYGRAAQGFRQGNMKEAVEAFAAAVSKRNELDNPMVQRLLRLKLQALNSQKAQIKALREELHSLRETQKEYAHEYYLMGNECITKAHDANAAIRCFDKALNLNPNYVEAWVRKGVTLLDIGEDYDAQVCLNKAVKLSPKSFKARYNRGKCLLKLKYYDEAILDFQQAVSIKPKHAASHEYLAEGFRAIGEDELAQRHQDIADALRGGEDI